MQHSDGETAVRDLYKASGKKKCSYTIIRSAAPLNGKPPVPVQDLLVLQRDVYSSGQPLSRTNMAEAVVSALFKGNATDFTTFEV
eukprot:scaffold7349_cov173-Amphora_coffeaeformis.AAC.91